MKYTDIYKGNFISRPNRFIANVSIGGKAETAHVKNTGRCRELLTPDAEVYLEKAKSPDRKTQWDLIAVKKGERLINMDSQAPNAAVDEWIRAGNLFDDLIMLKPETTFGESRFDFYAEYGDRKAFLEVKGVTLEEDGVVRFPDAPSERAVKHVRELIRAKAEGYDAYIFFVIQMKGVRYFTPNIDTHPEFAEVLKVAAEAGVRILAYDCIVTPDSIEIDSEVPIRLSTPPLEGVTGLMLAWYQSEKRDLPWRGTKDPYRVWVSEIMLQQTRVEAVKPYYERFLAELPNVHALANVPEDRLMKLWESLGYYSRVRNMQKAALQIENEYGGAFPSDYDKIRKLTGIGEYTAGAIGSIAFDIAEPAVDGNVLRVLSRYLASYEDIMNAKTRAYLSSCVREIMPKETPGDFNQSLIELGAIVCVPNGAPKCENCPLKDGCRAYAQGIQAELPVKKKPKERLIEKRTVLILREEGRAAIRKRPKKGLLAGLYELPNVEGHLSEDEVVAFARELGITPLHVKKLPAAKHIFSHIEWHMIGYEIRTDELAQREGGELIFVDRTEIQRTFSIPAAFGAYINYC